MDDYPAGIRCAERLIRLCKRLLRRRVQPPRVRPSRLKSRAAAVLFVVASLMASGCTTSLRQWFHNCFKVGPNYERPGAATASDWIDSPEQGIKRDAAVDGTWWTVFQDPALNGLVQSAYQQNLDLQAAGTRILNSRAQRNIAFGNLFPQTQRATAGYTHAQTPRNLGLGGGFPPHTVNVWDAGFNATWEADFWGRYRRSLESAEDTYEASVEDYGATLVMLLSNVATAYTTLRTFEQRLDFAQKNVEIQQGTLELAELRHKEGVATEVDVAQAQSNLAQTRALIPPLVAGRRQAANQLCVLMGMPVYDLENQLQPGTIPKVPIEVAVGIPADLLRRRPDVRRAERQAAAQSAQIGVAEADFYPRFAIQGFIGYAANDIPNLFTPGGFFGFIAPTLSWQVLNYGRIINNVRGQEAKLAELVLQYQQQVLIAGREVEDALVGFIQARQQAARLEESVRAAERSVELVVEQYKGGTADFNRVYNTQALLVNQQDQLATARGNIAINLISVYRALGGGWEYFSQGEEIAPVEYREAGTEVPAEIPAAQPAPAN